ncbi:MAG: hypothetical protein V4722_10690 [Bacteroidota bacterium]
MKYPLIACLIFSGFITLGAGFLYTYAKTVVPRKTPWIVIAGWAFLVLLAIFVNPFISFLLFIFYLLFILFYYRKQNLNAIQQFFIDFGIYRANNIPASVLAVLGNCSWNCAEGRVVTKSKRDLAFNWWQGHTTSTSYSGTTRATTITNYLAISLLPGHATHAFIEKVTVLADTSGYTFAQKFKRFFVGSTFVPFLVKETADGHFVMAWYINQTVGKYSEKLKWLRENA